MGITVSSEIKVNGLIGFRYVKEFHMENIPSIHPRAVVVCEMNPDADVTRGIIEKQVISIVKENEEVIFSGLIEQIVVEKKAQMFQKIRLNLVANSIELDREKKKRSFQNKDMTYDDIMHEVVEEHKGVLLETKQNQDMSIGAPIIQYEETDWEFIVRMESAYNCPIFVDETSEPSIIRAGELGDCGELEYYEYPCHEGICSTYNKKNDTSSAKYRYHRVYSPNSYPLGGLCDFKGSKYVICKKEAEIVNEELRYEYILACSEYIKVQQIFNNRFVGCTILGEVQNANKEEIELKLILENEKKHAKYFGYPWKPEAGNMFYCLPEKNAIVSLYFPNNDEKQAMAVNCVRRESEGSYDKDTLYFKTEDKKLLSMTKDDVLLVSYTEEISFVNVIAMISNSSLDTHFIESSIALGTTSNGLRFSSPAIGIAAAKEIGLHASVDNKCSIEIFGSAPLFLAAEELCLELLDYLHHDNGIDNGKFFPIIMDVPEIAEPGWSWGMALNIFVGIVAVAAVAALCVFALPAVLTAAGVAAATVTAVTAGATVGAVVTGTFVVVGQAIEDYNNGQAEDWYKVLGSTLLQCIGGAIEGAITALAGPVWQGGKFVWSAFGKMLLFNAGGNFFSHLTEYICNPEMQEENYLWSLAKSTGFSLIFGGIFDGVPWQKIFKGIGKKLPSGLGNKFANALDKIPIPNKFKESIGVVLEKIKANEDSLLKDIMDSKLYKKLQGKEDELLKKYKALLQGALDQQDEVLEKETEKAIKKAIKESLVESGEYETEEALEKALKEELEKVLKECGKDSLKDDIEKELKDAIEKELKDAIVKKLQEANKEVTEEAVEEAMKKVTKKEVDEATEKVTKEVIDKAVKEAKGVTDEAMKYAQKATSAAKKAANQIKGEVAKGCGKVSWMQLNKINVENSIKQSKKEIQRLKNVLFKQLGNQYRKDYLLSLIDKIVIESGKKAATEKIKNVTNEPINKAASAVITEVKESVGE